MPLSGSSCLVAVVLHGETVLTDNCYCDYVDLFNPFIVGKTNTPVNRRQGKVVLGSCGGVAFWHYPAGSYPFKTRPNSPVYGLMVSLET
jgi:hypothetical protein